MTERRVEYIIEATQDVVGIENRVFSHLAKTIGTMTKDVAKCSGEHTHLAMERCHPTESLRMVKLGCVLFLDEMDYAVLGSCSERQRTEGSQSLGEDYRP